MSDEQNLTDTPELPGVGIRVDGQLVAWFADPELAHEWATENFFGQWLAHACTMPNRPPFTLEQMELIRHQAEELRKRFKTPRMIEE